MIDDNLGVEMRIFGRVVAKPELLYSIDQGDINEVLSFQVEGTDGKKNASIRYSIGERTSYDVVCLSPLIDSLRETVEKGTFLHVKGKMRTREWTDDETGACVWVEEILATEVNIIGNDRKPYTYIEADSTLYGPDGTFLKQLYCPKAVTWNQLIADDPEDRSRGCWFCSERVLNLDVVNVREAVQRLKEHPSHCVFGSEKTIQFVVDPKKPTPRSLSNGTKPIVIYTARSEMNINRGAASGFWPDVRLVNYDTNRLRTKFHVSQDKQTGKITVSTDYRESFHDNEVIPWTFYYQYYQYTPLAAYLVPKGLPAGSPVVVIDPIEDVLKETWNQGDAYRARYVKGVWNGERIVLDTSAITVTHGIG